MDKLRGGHTADLVLDGFVLARLRLGLVLNGRKHVVSAVLAELDIVLLIHHFVF